MAKDKRYTMYAVHILNVNHIRFEIITGNAMKVIGGIIICEVQQLYGLAITVILFGTNLKYICVLFFGHGAQFLEKFIIHFITFKTQKPLKPSTSITTCSYARALQQEMLCCRMGKGDVHTRKKMYQIIWISKAVLNGSFSSYIILLSTYVMVSIIHTSQPLGMLLP